MSIGRICPRFRDYTGLWEYPDENLWLRIYEDATWEFVNDQEDVIEYGTLWADENGVTLHFDGSGDTLQLDRSVSGDLINSVNGDMLFPAESNRQDRIGDEYGREE